MVGIGFGNPAGWLALLAFPVVLALHFLQRRVRREVVATGFLLPANDRRSERGRRWERLRRSVPLWLQLLAVVVLAVVLAGPRWHRGGEVQRLVLVLDGSASLRVSRDRMLRYLREDLARMENGGVTLELLALDSRPGRSRIHYGQGVEGLLESLTAWEPGGSSHDTGPVLAMARKLAGSGGLVWLVSDRMVRGLPEGVGCYAVGEAVENAGVAGVHVEDTEGGMVWKALLRNHAAVVQERRWRVETRGGEPLGAWRKEVLEPRGMAEASGAFPSGSHEMVLRLEADGFPDDDAVPLVRPRPRPLRLALDGVGGVGLRQLLESLEAVELVTAAADLAVRGEPGPEVRAERLAGVIFLTGGGAQRERGPVLVERHELTRELDWQGLLVESVSPLTLRESDEVLVWSGMDPLVVLRGRGVDRQLICCFAPERSNALRLPALVVAMHRFVEGQRALMVSDAVVNAECGQLLRPVAEPTGGAVRWEWEEMNGKPGRADLSLRELPWLEVPGAPCFFRLRQGDRDLVRGAAALLDVREADFAEATTDRTVADLVRGRETDRPAGKEPFWRPALLVLLLVLLAGWVASDAVRAPVRAR